MLRYAEEASGIGLYFMFMMSSPASSRGKGYPVWRPNVDLSGNR